MKPRELKVKEKAVLEIFHYLSCATARDIYDSLCVRKPELSAGGTPSVYKCCKTLERLGYIEYREVFQGWSLSKREFKNKMSN